MKPELKTSLDTPIKWRNLAFICLQVVDWLATNQALSAWFDLSWPFSVPIAVFIVRFPGIGPVVALYAMNQIWGWPWWAVALMTALHLEMYSTIYLSRKEDVGD